MSPEIAVITGPTATGKTALAIALAQKLGGEIISADAMQIYRGMEVGTAKPTAAERAAAVHHMIDVAETGEDYSAARYGAEAATCVRDVLIRGRLPIVCGGTGLYIDALVKGNAFSPTDPALRADLEAQWDAVGGPAMQARLRAVDPETAARLAPADRKRILRALEVWTITGETLAAYHARCRATPPRFRAKTIALNIEPRAALYARIDVRVDAMWAAGLACEAEKLYNAGKLTGTAAQAIGYKELITVFRGESSLDAARALIKQHSRNYAKRQLTWLRRRPDIFWLTYDGNSAQLPSLVCQATDFLRPSR
jgi:tRNA dimethylallyltransferase